MRTPHATTSTLFAALVSTLLPASWSAAQTQASLSPAWQPAGAVDTIEERFVPPTDFARLPAPDGSFATWLRGLPLYPADHPVFQFDGRLKSRQDVHEAVVAIDVGDRDLQQCADAVIRLRAEYLLAEGCQEAIRFDFTSGDTARWQDWAAGSRPRIGANRVTWERSAPADSSYANFRRYLDRVFTYAGTASLSRELTPVTTPRAIEVGDVFIQGGFPGHAVLVVDVVQNARGDRRFLLAQSYMPAQEIHILRNPQAPETPWYQVSLEGPLQTPEWRFDGDDLRRFPTRDCTR